MEHDEPSCLVSPLLAFFWGKVSLQNEPTNKGTPSVTLVEGVPLKIHQITRVAVFVQRKFLASELIHSQDQLQPIGGIQPSVFSRRIESITSTGFAGSG